MGANEVRESLPVFGVGDVAVPDEPLEDFVAEERELPTTCWAVGGNNTFPGPSSDYLFTRGQELGEILGVHHRADVRIPAFVGVFRIQVLSHRRIPSAAGACWSFGPSVRLSRTARTSSRKNLNC